MEKEKSISFTPYFCISFDLFQKKNKSDSADYKELYPLMADRNSPGADSSKVLHAMDFDKISETEKHTRRRVIWESCREATDVQSTTVILCDCDVSSIERLSALESCHHRRWVDSGNAAERVVIGSLLRLNVSNTDNNLICSQKSKLVSNSKDTFSI